MPRISFRPQARAEIREVRGWYEAQVPGLGRVFIAELDATRAFLKLYPQMYVAVSDDGHARRALLHRFPYSLVYEVMAAALLFYCVQLNSGVEWRRSRTRR